MDILWFIVGGSIVVGFLFFILAKYWQGVLASYARTISRLSERVRALEEMKNPDFRKKIQRASPLPLKRVCSFVFHLHDAFWQDTLHATPEEMAFVRKYGSFLGSVKIEQWRSHSVVTLYEVLPRNRSGDWRIRSIDVYPADNGRCPVTLWELPLGVHREGFLELPPVLELRLEDGRLQLCALHDRFGCEYLPDGTVLPKRVNLFLDLPLEAVHLTDFRKPETPEDAATLLDSRGKSLGALYQHTDERLGIEWRLCIRNLERRQDSSRWSRWAAPERRPD